MIEPIPDPSPEYSGKRAKRQISKAQKFEYCRWLPSLLREGLGMSSKNLKNANQQNYYH